MWDRGGGIRWGVWVVLTLGILLSVYLASPLIALHSIARAVEIKDAIALTEHRFSLAQAFAHKAGRARVPEADWKKTSAACNRQARRSLDG